VTLVEKFEADTVRLDVATASIVALCVTHAYDVAMLFIEVDGLAETTTLLAPLAGLGRQNKYPHQLVDHICCFPT